MTDAELRELAASCEDMPFAGHVVALLDRIEAVRALHTRLAHMDVCSYCDDHGNYVDWPCPTIRALDGET